jgi:hypothetical protein
MSEETVVAAPSAAESGTIELPRSGTPEYAQWRVDGSLPEKKTQPNEADSATADASKETGSESAPEPEAGKPTQESRRKPGAEARIGELTGRVKQLERELEEARKPKSDKPTQTAESSPAPDPKPESNRPKPTHDAKDKDGKPLYGTYEDYIEDLADWKAEQRIAAQQREQSAAQQRQAVSQKLEEARSRYSDYDSVAIPVVQELLKPGISREVFAVLNDSPVLADLLYTIGGSEQSKADFLAACRSNPSKALRVALLMEQEIVKELGQGKEEPQGLAGRNERGQFVAKEEPKTPAKRKPESAAEPPIEIGNRGASTLDATERAFKDGDFRSWKAAEDAKDLRRRRGA